MTRNDLDETFMPMTPAVDDASRAGPPADDRGDDPEDPVLYVAAFEPRSFVAGPGMRAMVWVAGCHRRCPGCSQPEFLPFNSGRPVRVSELWDRIQTIPGLDGVSFSGGEPYEQASALAVLAKKVHDHGLTVVSYTGYRLEALQAEPSRFSALLSEVDLLIDGEYREEMAGHHRWRGSANQRLICLTDRIKNPEETGVSEMQITFGSGGPDLVFSGILSPELVRELRERLADRGLPTARRG